MNENKNGNKNTQPNKVARPSIEKRSLFNEGVKKERPNTDKLVNPFAEKTEK